MYQMSNVETLYRSSVRTFQHILPYSQAKLIVQPREIEALVEQRDEAADFGFLLEANMAEDALGALNRGQCVVGHQDNRHFALLGAIEHCWRWPDIAGQHQRRG